MIATAEITNFKSIKQLKLDCKRINIFIGEPNVEKSNILEALGIFSFGYYSSYGGLADFVRFERISNLFYDENSDEEMEIKFDNKVLKIRFKNGKFEGRWNEGEARLARMEVTLLLSLPLLLRVGNYLPSNFTGLLSNRASRD